MRNHPLKIGETVYDYNVNYWGVITSLKDGKATLAMNGDTYQENIRMFDCEIPEEETEWETNDLDALYQIAPGLVARDGNIICYEHYYTRDNYPYFSPYLDENLFSFETFTREEYENR